MDSVPEQWTVVGKSKSTKRRPQISGEGHPAGAHGPSDSTPCDQPSTSPAQASEGLPGWDDGWKQPKARRKRDKHSRGGRQGGWQEEAIKDSRREVQSSAVYRNLETAFQELTEVLSQSNGPRDLSSIQELVVYGLGSLEAGNVTPRYQLALSLLLAEHHLPGLARPIQQFDPVFTPDDCSLLERLGCQVIGRNEEGSRDVRGVPTFFYLPHCEAKLCDRLLHANWSATSLPQIVILGNSFSTIASRWELKTGAPAGQDPPGHVIAAVQQRLVVEIPVKDTGFAVPSAFNDMSLHCFPSSSDVFATPEVWRDLPQRIVSQLYP